MPLSKKSGGRKSTLDFLVGGRVHFWLVATLSQKFELADARLRGKVLPLVRHFDYPPKSTMDTVVASNEATFNASSATWIPTKIVLFLDDLTAPLGYRIAASGTCHSWFEIAEEAGAFLHSTALSNMPDMTTTRGMRTALFRHLTNHRSVIAADISLLAVPVAGQIPGETRIVRVCAQDDPVASSIPFDRSDHLDSLPPPPPPPQLRRTDSSVLLGPSGTEYHSHNGSQHFSERPLTAPPISPHTQFAADHLLPYEWPSPLPRTLPRPPTPPRTLEGRRFAFLTATPEITTAETLLDLRNLLHDPPMNGSPGPQPQSQTLHPLPARIPVTEGDQVEAAEGAPACPICYTFQPRIAIAPCGHVVCAQCANELIDRSCECYCRGPVNSTLRLYMTN
jgi:hypothetical protein